MITTSAGLSDVCATARRGGVLSLDTEFVWRRTYHPLLGLVQMADAAGSCQAVDCLCALDPAPLGALIADAGVVKILHDARQDLDHLRRWTGCLPVNVFDTQLAAAFAGFPARVGLQRLLQDALDIGLAKTETLTDWMQRPLTPAQVAYALDDVRHLAELREELLHRAEALGTRAWLEEDMARLSEPSTFAELDPQEAWLHVKCGRVRLNGRGRAALRVLAAVRETMARDWNMPKAWLTEDLSLADLAADWADDSASVAHLRFRHRLRNGPRDTLAALYSAALSRLANVAEAECPADPNPRYLPEVVDAARQAFAWMQTHAAEVHVDPAIVANRASVLAFMDVPDEPGNLLARGWRYDVFGREMVNRFGC